MGRKFLLYGFGAIALYLGVVYYAGFSKDTTAATSGGATLVKAFQGR